MNHDLLLKQNLILLANASKDAVARLKKGGRNELEGSDFDEMEDVLRKARSAYEMVDGVAKGKVAK